MRNFKKVLSLVLCMAMMLSVMVVGAGAAFKDQDKIVNDEAVDMCAALNIINGYKDGSYKPEGNITRAEACKMICVALNGGEEPTLGTSAKASFTDTKGHWAEKYIESCVAQGIVAGIGGGKFNPAGNITGTQFAKMLLTALGFNADTQGYVGAPWEVKVNVDASAKGLYADLAGMDPAKALSRDNAAQMVWNALNAYEVEYKYNLVTQNGQLVSELVLQDKVGLDGKTKMTLLEDKYEAETATGVLADYTWSTSDKQYIYELDNAKNDNDTFKSATDFGDLYGMNVKVVYSHDKKTGTDKVYGIVADDSKVVVESVVGKIDDLNNIKEGTTTKVKVDGTEYKIDKDITGYTFCEGQISSLNAFTAKYPNSYKAFNFKAIDNNGNDKIDTVVVYPVTIAKLTYVNNSGVRVGATEYKFEDHDIYKGAAKDDWVVITAADNTANDKAVIVKADVVSGKVSSVKTENKATTQVRVDGTWYKSLVNNDKTAISDKVDLVVYNGYYFDVDGTSSALDVAVVTGVGNYDRLNDTTDVRLMFKDGKEEVVAVEKWNGKPASGTNAFTGMADCMVSYDVDDDKYTLTTVVDGQDIGSSDYTGVVATDSLSYDKDKAAIVKGKTEYDIADNAMVVIKNSDDKYVFMSGADLMAKNDISFAKAYVAVDGNEVGALFATTKASVTTGDKLYGYITEVGMALNGSDKERLYIDVVIDGKKLENVETDKKSADGWTAGTVISYTMDGDVMCITKETNVNQTAAIKEFNASRVLFYDNSDISKTNRFLLTKDTVIIAIDSSDTDDVLYAGDALMAANAEKFNEDGTVKSYYKNAKYYANTDGEIEVIFVQVAADEGF